MKLLKILLMFLVILGVILGVIVFLGSDASSSGVNGNNDPAFQAARDDIERSWEATEEWSDELYEMSVENLRQQQEDLGSGYQTLFDMLNEHACVRLDKLMMQEFAKSDCNNSRVKALKQGLDKVLNTTPSLAQDQRVRKMLGTYNLYTQILAFGRGAHGCSTGYAFNGGNARWNNFEAHASSVRAKRDGFKRREYFANIRNISAITAALNGVEGKLQSARASFAASLARDIRRSFEAQDHDDMRDMLRATYNRYSSSYRNAELSAYVNGY